jgi:hypothetical protein
MAFKHPSVLISGYLNLSTPAFATLPTPLSSSCTRLRNQRLRQRNRHAPRPRRYATIADASSFDTSDEALPWPTASPHKPPSPYDVFNQSRGDKYSKRRFYELVMKYHPDRNSHPDESTSSPNPCKCPKEEMLERYRLVVAANAILSDPEKRAAYDNFGLGWMSDMNGGQQSPLHKYSTYHRWRKTGDTAYKWPTDQDPMYNATWEDWERWYREQSARSKAKSSMPIYGHFFTAGHGRQSTGVFMGNGAFISIVFLFALLGGIGQATRVNDYSKSRTEQLQQMNDETHQVLMRARQDAIEQSNSGENKKKRIQRFIASIEGAPGYDASGEFEPRALRPGEDDGLCISGTTKDRDQPRFWEKPPPPDGPPRAR